MPKLQITYYAVLREQRGLSSEEVTTAARTGRELYAELAARHQFSLPVDRLRLAIGGEFASWETPLADGAKLVLIPPVAGG